MFNKFISSALLFLVVAQVAMASPKPVACGGPDEPACPPACVPACADDEFCCGSLTPVRCVAAGGFCPVIG
ncbi:hypothetical protein MVEN_02549200 [Mycena venus]|uniref:Granulins domain-containing protein n=1 Tax=Mycena venus TaxID=2733690 RepID=A0A8H6WSI7_9AGAR|nr:hypothetical protein MVEN_02549200 [Mycena venus]